MAGLIGTTTTSKNGLMSSDFYNIGKRKEISLGGDNAGKIINILSVLQSTYRRTCVKVEGFFEGKPLFFMIYSQSSNTNEFTTVIHDILPIHDSVKIYKKVADGKFKIFLRSTGSSGNPCYVQITHYGQESLNEIGYIYDFYDSFTLIE